MLRENGSGVRLEAPGSSLLSVAALAYSDGAIEAATIPQDLRSDGRVHLHIDHLRRGVGTGSCGPDTPAKYRIGAGRYDWSWAIWRLTPT